MAEGGDFAAVSERGVSARGWQERLATCLVLKEKENNLVKYIGRK
jgi:hypothetical protein